MGTTTPRLGLYKAAGSGELVDVETQVNAAFDKIDDAIGARQVTSGTRPASPYRGQIIEETDTGYVYMWNGALWYPIVRPPAAIKGFTEVPNGKRANNLAQGETTLNFPFKYDVHAKVILTTGFSSAVADNGWVWEKTAGVGTLSAMSTASVNAPAGKWVTLVDHCVITDVTPNQNLTFRGLVQVSTTDSGGSYFRGRVEYDIIPKQA